MTISKSFLLVALLFCSAFSYEASHFKESNVLLKNEDGENYYIVLAISKFYFNETKFQKESYLTLKAKANLSNFLNAKNGGEFAYTFKGFLPITYFEDGKSAGIIAKIAKNNIAKSDKTVPKQTFEEFIKTKIKDLSSSDIIRFEDDYYLVAFASIDIKGVSLQKRVEAIRTADMKSQKEFLVFVKGEDVQVKEKLKRVLIDANGTLNEFEELSKEIEIKSSGYIKNQKTLNFQEDGFVNSVTYSKFDF